MIAEITKIILYKFDFTYFRAWNQNLLSVQEKIYKYCTRKRKKCNLCYKSSLWLFEIIDFFG